MTNVFFYVLSGMKYKLSPYCCNRIQSGSHGSRNNSGNKTNNPQAASKANNVQQSSNTQNWLNFRIKY